VGEGLHPTGLPDGEESKQRHKLELKKVLALRVSACQGFSPGVATIWSVLSFIHSRGSSPSTLGYFIEGNGKTPRTRFSPKYSPPPEFDNCEHGGFNHNAMFSPSINDPCQDVSSGAANLDLNCPTSTWWRPLRLKETRYRSFGTTGMPSASNMSTE
jgi:hypothetical protein